MNSTCNNTSSSGTFQKGTGAVELNWQEREDVTHKVVITTERYNSVTAAAQKIMHVYLDDKLVWKGSTELCDKSYKAKMWLTEPSTMSGGTGEAYVGQALITDVKYEKYWLDFLYIIF